MTYLVALAFLAILGSLATALFFMMKDGTNGKAKTSNMARALAFRIGFSVLLFVCAVMFFIFVLRRNADELLEDKVKPVDIFWSMAKMLLILLVIYGLFHG